MRYLNSYQTLGVSINFRVLYACFTDSWCVNNRCDLLCVRNLVSSFQELTREQSYRHVLEAQSVKDLDIRFLELREEAVLINRR